MGRQPAILPVGPEDTGQLPTLADRRVIWALGAAVLAIPATAVAAGLWPDLGQFAVACAFGWALLALAASDLRRMILPDYLTLPLVPAGLVHAYIWGDPAWVGDCAIGAVAGFAVLLVLNSLYHHWRGRDGLGGGDMKLLAAAGAWVGWQGLPILVLSAALMALAVVGTGWLRGWSPRRDERVPFGAYLALALWAIWLYGPSSV